VSPVPAQMWAGVSPDPAQMWAGVSPVPAQMWAGVSPVPAQMWAGVSPVPAQMLQGVSPVPAHYVLGQGGPILAAPGRQRERGDGAEDDQLHPPTEAHFLAHLLGGALPMRCPTSGAARPQRATANALRLTSRARARMCTLARPPYTRTRANTRPARRGLTRARTRARARRIRCTRANARARWQIVQCSPLYVFDTSVNVVAKLEQV
jgi:hypothetical protein